MRNGPVIIVAMNQELTTDAHLRRKFATALNRAGRQAARYKDIDLARTEQQVAENLLATQLRMGGEYLGLPDLINRAMNGRNPVAVTPDNVANHLSLANTVTLNGIFLYAYLKQRGFDAAIVQNWAAHKSSFEELLARDPLAVLVSSTYLSMETIREIGAWVKERRPDVPVITGGPLVNKVLQPREKIATTTKKWLDGFRSALDVFVIESQGEKTLIKLLTRIREGRSFDDVENLALQDNGKWVFTPVLEEPVHMDEGMIPWDEIPAEYLRLTIPVNTSRGCVFHCRFCTYRKLVKGIHYKSLGCLERELQALARVSTVKHVRFTDDNFTASGQRLEAVCRLLVDMGSPFTWTSFARADSITPEKAHLMREAGCVLLEMGLESGSPEILQNMDKRQSVDGMRRAIDILNRENIAGSGAFIVGYPGETEETLQQTVDLINETRLPYYRLNFFAFSKGMLLYEEREKYGLSGLGYAWKHNTMDAVQASRHLGRMMRDISYGVSDGLSSTWETFKLLSGKGATPEAIHELFAASNELNRLRFGSGENDPQWSRIVDEWWGRFESLLYRAIP